MLNKNNIKKSIFEIIPYKPGASKLGDREVIKLSSNENPLGCSKKVAAANLKDLNRYPEGTSQDLRAQLAKLHQIDQNRIICGAGSDEIISLIINAFTKEGDEIIYPEYGFLMYRIYALSNGVIPVTAKEHNLRADINEILAKVTDRTRVVFIANPNNPTGSYLTKQELRELREKLREDIFLVIDGAYAEYVDLEDYESGIDLANKYDNVIATRTFSKIYGLAALRLGYGYMSLAAADIVNRIRSPFNVNSVAQKLGEIAVLDQGFIKESKEHNDFWLKELGQEFSKLGLEYHDSVANFLLVNLGSEQKAIEFSNFLNDKSGIIVRPVASYSLPEKVRITIGTKQENIKLIDTIRAYYNG